MSWTALEFPATFNWTPCIRTEFSERRVSGLIENTAARGIYK